jgi:signal-transduction protein with cAMP-binding, CBS, and nucleotidyltransferase domain
MAARPVEQTAGGFMRRYLEVVEKTSTVLAVAERMRVGKIGSILVGVPGEPGQARSVEGIVTETDLVRRVVAHEMPADKLAVDRVMTAPPLTIEAERSMLDANQLMEQHRVRHLCVTEGGRIAGVISVRDLVRYFLSQESGPLSELDDVHRPLGVLMQRAIETIDERETMLEAARRMANRRIGALLVTGGSEKGPLGIVTESNLVRDALPYDLDPRDVPISALMTQPVLTIDINRTVHDANDLMAERGVRHLIVTEHGRVVGILSVRDLIRMVSIRDKSRFLQESSKRGRG